MVNLAKLNLPSFEHRLKYEDDVTYIFDSIRKKYIMLTPEEWVRQNFINLLINHLHYPKGLMNVETGLSYFKNSKRSDITINNREQSVFMLIECKSPEIKIDKRTLTQISQYNKEICANYISVTNGLKHFIWEYSVEKKSYLQLNSFPDFIEK